MTDSTPDDQLKQPHVVGLFDTSHGFDARSDDDEAPARGFLPCLAFAAVLVLAGFLVLWACFPPAAYADGPEVGAETYRESRAYGEVEIVSAVAYVGGQPVTLGGVVTLPERASWEYVVTAAPLLTVEMTSLPADQEIMWLQKADGTPFKGMYGPPSPERDQALTAFARQTETLIPHAYPPGSIRVITTTWEVVVKSLAKVVAFIAPFLWIPDATALGDAEITPDAEQWRAEVFGTQPLPGIERQPYDPDTLWSIGPMMPGDPPLLIMPESPDV